MKKPFIGIGFVLLVILGCYLIIGEISQGSEGEEVTSNPSFSLTDNNTVELTRNVRHKESQPVEPKVTLVEEPVICLKVENQLPVGIISTIPPETRQVFGWGRVINGKGVKIRYLWYFDNKVTTSGWQLITSHRFRSWCPYSVGYNASGSGRMEIVTDKGELLARVSFKINRTNRPANRTRPLKNKGG